MKAMVFRRYGGVENLIFEEVDKPEPKEDEVRLKVRAASVNPDDYEVMKGRSIGRRFTTGLFTPQKKILGIDVAGTVDAMGPQAMECELGQEVYADLSDHGYGAYAEYVCVPKSAIALKPRNLAFTAAATLPFAGTTALQGLFKGDILSYRSALIIGASGGVGHFALQIAKSYGLQVTAVCSTQKIEMVKALGADRIIDYTKTDYTKTDDQYELIFDAAGKHSAGKFRKMLTRDGRYVACAYNPSAYVHAPIRGILTNRRVVTYDTIPSTEDLATLRRMVESKKITPYVDRVFSLKDLPEAMHYLKSGNVKGKVAIEMGKE
jgi:NADPH:quinone reductase-like Zn-dependent oxidoreductase